MSVQASAAYYDFGQLATLRGQAERAPGQALSEVAGQFEALFTQMMLKSMREATLKGELFGSNQMDLYQSMLDQQLSLEISSQSGLGLADVLVQQLDGGETADTTQPVSLAAYAHRVRAQAPVAANDTESFAPVPAGTRFEDASGTQASASMASTIGSTTASTAVSNGAWRPESLEEFVGDIWDGAVDAAKALGLDPLVLVAQSALETGWGKRVIRAMDGSSSFNLFGIKASGEWRGADATVDTLEYRDGVAEKESARFRVYDSIASSFSDYVSFLKSNPRYQEALERVADSRAFVQGLQDAGYATDPNYAAKIINIMNNPALTSALESLKK